MRDPARAVPEVADLIGQVRRRDPDQARELYERTVSRVGTESRRRLDAVLSGDAATQEQNGPRELDLAVPRSDGVETRSITVPPTPGGKPQEDVRDDPGQDDRDELIAPGEPQPDAPDPDDPDAPSAPSDPEAPSEPSEPEEPREDPCDDIRDEIDRLQDEIDQNLAEQREVEEDIRRNEASIEALKARIAATLDTRDAIDRVDWLPFLRLTPYVNALMYAFRVEELNKGEDNQLITIWEDQIDVLYRENEQLSAKREQLEDEQTSLSRNLEEAKSRLTDCEGSKND